MKKQLLFITLACLVTPIQAKIGDTYSCQMTEYWSTEKYWTGKVEKLPLETFSFKREMNSYGDEIIIKPGFYEGSINFASGYYDVTNTYGVENFTAQGSKVYMTYHNQHNKDDDINETGWFNWVLLYPLGIESVLAMCKID
jgi:hypothetical protein